MPRYAMVIDLQRCVGCSACSISCRNENNVPDGIYWSNKITETSGTFPNVRYHYIPTLCNHCENAPCVSACPTGASHVNEGGTVLVTRHKCTGCKACIAACPYDARYVHEEGFVDKCTFCLHRVQRGELPACVGVCPTEALQFGDLNDPDSDVSRLLRGRKHKVQKAELMLYIAKTTTMDK